MNVSGLEKKNKYKAPVLVRDTSSSYFKFYGDLISIANGRVALDGVGIVEQKLVTNVYDLTDFNLNVDFFKVKGSLAIYSEINLDGITYFKINPDPIGACVIYKYEKNGVVAFSSDLRHLVDCLKSLGIEVRKSVFYQALLVIMNNGGFGYSSYEDVFTLDPYKYIIAHHDGFSIVDYGIADFLKSEDSYKNLLDLAELDISNTISAISESSLQKIVHLTGGMDSRLVVAAIRYRNEINKYKVFCSGERGFPDFDTAYSLCGELDAQMTNKPTLTQDVIPKNFEELYRWSAQDNQGVLSNQPPNIGASGVDDTIILSGGYGECLRTFYGEATGVSLGSISNAIWYLYDNKGSIRVPVTEYVVNNIKSGFEFFCIKKLDQGWNLNDALQLYYLEERNRYYVGNITLSYSRHTPRIDPLYSLYGIKAAYRMNFADRKNRFLIYDLMSKFSSELTKFKFGTTEWPQSTVDRYAINVKDFSISNNVKFERHAGQVNFDWLNTISPESKKEAVRTGAPAWQIHHYRNIQEEAKSILTKKPEFYEFFDKLKTSRLLNNKLNNRQSIRKVFQLYYALVWLYK
jgi:hypothetical protein